MDGRAPTFVFRAQQATARAHEVDGTKLMVLKGSTALKLNTSSTTDRDREVRDALVRDGTLAPHHRDAALYVFTRDHEFASASQAAGVIKNGNVSGPQAWINPATGKSLKDSRES